MRRREFITVLGGAAVWPLPLRAQQQRPVIGFLGTVAQELWVKPVAAFEERLREHGWIDGRTIKIIYRWAEGRPERFAEIATEFVNSNVDVIVTGGNASLLQGRRHRLFRSSSPWPSTPLAAGLLIAFRDQAAMSPASLCRALIWPASDSSCCASLPLVATLLATADEIIE